MPEPPDILSPLQSGLSLRMLEGELALDRPAPIRRLSSATVRGLAGTLLLRHNPEAFRGYFKPPASANTSPGYLFQPVLEREELGTFVPFRLVTWESSGNLLESFKSALDAAIGEPFGESGARVLGCSFSDTYSLRFRGARDADHSLLLELFTPLQFRQNRRSLRAQDLTLGHLVLAAVQRLNSLSLAWGNRILLDPSPFLAASATCPVRDVRLHQVSPARRSSTQDESILLGGIVGSLLLPSPPKVLADLLSIGEILHLGRHTAVGCGKIRLRSARVQSNG